jgi:hypothetical protein
VLREEALAAMREAADTYRELAAAHPDAFRPDLAMALTNLSAGLAGLGRRKDALAAIREAVTIRRKLAARWPMSTNTTWRCPCDSLPGLSRAQQTAGA